MKFLKAILLSVALAMPLVTSAQTYSAVADFWVVADFTNNPAVATNLAANIVMTRRPDFVLEVIGAFTNATAGTLDMRWCTSSDGVNFCDAPATPGASGWFSVPLTNTGVNFTWSTNITVPQGYWQLSWVTNLAVQHMTNISIKGWAKPVRQGN